LLPVVALDGDSYEGELGNDVVKHKTDSNRKGAASQLGGHGDQVLDDPGHRGVDADVVDRFICLELFYLFI
jgi:hypothetical protein